MKVLQVTPIFYPSKSNGTKTLSHSIARALAIRKHDVTVFTTDAFSRLENGLRSAEIDGIKVKYFPNLSIFLARYRIFLPLQLISAMRKEAGNFDIIHIHGFRGLSDIVTHHYAKKYGVPYVIDAHGAAARAHDNKKNVKYFLRWTFDMIFGNRVLRDAGRCIGETEVGVKEYVDLGIDNSNIVLLPPPFPVEQFAQLPPRGQFREKYQIKEKYVVTFLGRIHFLKGIDFLVDGFAELAQSRNDVRLVIVGPDDGYKTELQNQISRLNLTDKALFTGFLDGQDKLSALVDADVVIQTSRYEQGAWAPMEAVLCGTPIIVTGHTGAGEDVKKMNAGELVEFGNKKSLAELIGGILDNPAAAKSKTQKAADFIKANLSMSKKIEDYEKVYLECIEENKHKKRDVK